MQPVLHYRWRACPINLFISSPCCSCNGSLEKREEEAHDEAAQAVCCSRQDLGICSPSLILDLANLFREINDQLRLRGLG